MNNATRTYSFKALLAGLFAVAAGAVVLAGWRFDIPSLKSVLPGLVTMKANTAAGFILAGLSLALLGFTVRSAWARHVSRMCAGAAALLGFLTLCQSLFGLDFGIDQRLFREAAGAVGTLAAGRMAPVTAVTFLLLGGALFLAGFRRAIPAAQWLVLVTGLMGVLPLLGYVYGETAPVGVGRYMQTAVHTAMLFILLSLGTLLLHPAAGLMRAFTSETVGGWLWRRLAPFAVVVPLVLGWLRVQGEQRGYFDCPLGVALTMVVLMLVLTGLIGWVARTTNALRESAENVQTILKTTMDGFFMVDRQGRFREVNDTYCGMLGYRRDELLRMSIPDVEGDETPAEVAAHVQRIVQTGRAQFERRQRRKDGKLLRLEVSVTFLPFDGGRLVCFLRDTTDRQRAKERLERINACLMELGPEFDANIGRLTALSGELLGATCAFYNRLEGGMLCSLGRWHAPPGYEPGDRPDGRLCHDVIRQGGDGARVIRNLPETPYAATDPDVARYGLKTYFGHVVRRAGEPVGSLCVLFQEDAELTDDNNRVLGIIASCLGREEDRKRAEAQAQAAAAETRRLLEAAQQSRRVLLSMMEDEKRAEAELKKSEELLNEMGRIAEVGGWEFDVVTQEQVWTDETYRIHELDRSHRPSVSKGIAFYAPASKPVIERAVQHAIADGAPFDLELEFMTAKGNLRWVHVIGRADRECGKILGIIQDITDRKRAHEESSQTLQWQQGINLVQQSLLTPAPLEDKLRKVTDSIVRIFGADFCRVWLIRPGDLCERGCVHAGVKDGPQVCRYRDRCLHLLASSGRYTHLDGQGHRRVPFGVYKIGRVASGEDHKFLTNDVQHDPRVHNPQWARELGLVAFAGYQLRIPGDETLGVLALFAKHPILPAEDALLDGLSSALAHVVQHAKTEAAVRASEERYRGLVEESPDTIFIAGEDGIAFINPAGLRLLGASRPEQVLGKPLLQFIHPDFQEIVTRRIASGGLAPQLEEKYLRLDGTTVDVEVTAIPLLFDNKPGAQVILHDITARKRAAESQARLAMAVEQIAETIMITDANAMIIYTNPAFEKTSGYTREEAIGQTPQFMRSDRQDADFYQQMWTVLNRGEVWRGHLISKRKDGTVYEEDTSISPVRDAAGKIVNYVAAKRDVTHEAQLESQLRQAQKMEAVGRLAGGVAHDFNNMLQAILGTTELLLEATAADDPRAADLHEILTVTQRSADLTRQLLAFARKQVITPRVLDLNETVANMLKMLRRLIGEDITLAWLPGANLRPVKLDPSQVDQLLANLCVNARDAIAGVGKITLETGNFTFDADYCASHADTIPGEYVFLTVSDTGGGMAPETLAQIFEPFFTTKGVGQGTGLGLATVYGIVKQNRGFIYAYSELGQGATFKIYLPQVADAAVETAVISAAAAPKGRGETILLAEDEKSLRMTCKRILDALGYNVLLAETPEDALKLAERHAGDIPLLLTDVVMPGMDGRQLAQRLGAARPGIKVLFMSGYTADVMANRGVLEQHTAFIAKPFTRDVLARKVREVLDTQEAATPDTRQ